MFIPITKDSYLVAERIHSVIPEEFLQFRKIKKIFQENDVLSQHEKKPIKGGIKLIDITYGKSVKTVIFMDSGHMVLTSINANKIIDKVKKGRRNEL